MNPEDTLYTRAPGRIILAGAATDLPPYRDEFGGCVLSVALRLYSYAVLRPRPDERVVLRRLNDGTVYEGLGPAGLPKEGPLPLLQAIVNRVRVPRGFELDLFTDLPPAMGLGSSASTGVAALAVLTEYADRVIERRDFARGYARLDTNESLRESLAGRHDSFACALGGVTAVRIDADIPTEQGLVLKESVRLSFEVCGVLVGSGVSLPVTPVERLLTGTEPDPGPRRKIQHRIKANAQVCRDALAVGDLRRLAKQLNDDNELFLSLLESLDLSIIRHLLTTGRDAGAAGAKMCGPTGGCLFFLCPDPEARVRTLDALRREGCTPLPFQIDETGVRIWRQPQLNS